MTPADRTVAAYLVWLAYADITEQDRADLLGSWLWDATDGWAGRPCPPPRLGRDSAPGAPHGQGSTNQEVKEE